MIDHRLMETLRKNLQTITLEELFGYITEVEMGYIRIGYHPEDDNIVILNYTELATFERRWNKYTMTARGLILDLTDINNNGKIYVLAKGFDKFPNYDSGEIEGYEDDIDHSDIENIMEKMDGSLGISYFFKDGIRFATRGSFISDQAIKATEIWNKKYAHKLHRQHYVGNPYTIMAEIIYPQNRVVVDYEGMEDLVLLGIRNLHNELDADEADLGNLKTYSYMMDMPMAGIYEITSIDELVAMKSKLSANEEGWIVKFRNGKRLKIKGDEYIELHRLLYGLSDKSKVKAWQEGRLQEYIMELPEEFRPELEYLEEKLNVFKDAQYFMLQSMFEVIKEKYPVRKDFAIHVNSVINPNYRKHMFHALSKGSISVEMIKEDIYKNYRDYIEVINTWKHNSQNQDS